MKKILICTLLPLLICSCKSSKIDNVEIKASQSLQIADTLQLSTQREKVDSTAIYDSISTVYRDSLVYVDRFHVEYRYKYLNTVDTLYKTKYIEKVDSIDKPVYITKTVTDHSLYWWQSVLCYLGLVTLAVGCYKLYSLLKVKLPF